MLKNLKFEKAASMCDSWYAPVVLGPVDCFSHFLDCKSLALVDVLAKFNSSKLAVPKLQSDDGFSSCSHELLKKKNKQKKPEICWQTCFGDRRMTIVH